MFCPYLSGESSSRSSGSCWASSRACTAVRESLNSDTWGRSGTGREGTYVRKHQHHSETSMTFDLFSGLISKRFNTKLYLKWRYKLGSGNFFFSDPNFPPYARDEKFYPVYQIWGKRTIFQNTKLYMKHTFLIYCGKCLRVE